MMLHSYTQNQYPYQLLSINFLHLTLSEIQPRQDFKTQDHNCKVKVKSRSHRDIHTYIPHSMSLPSVNFLHLAVSELARTRF